MVRKVLIENAVRRASLLLQFVESTLLRGSGSSLQPSVPGETEGARAYTTQPSYERVQARINERALKAMITLTRRLIVSIYEKDRHHEPEGPHQAKEN